MIVVCERCSTRFKLDEARIPARGAQVRCSRCKHAFFVSAPGATADTVVQDVVAEATGPGGSSAPTVTTDLDHTAFDTAAGGLAESDDDEWEFNEDPPAASRARPDPGAAPQARAPAPELEIARPAEAPEPESAEVPDSLLDELGDPEGWDFGGESAADSAAPQAADPAPAAQEEPAEAEPAPAPSPKASKPKRGRRGRKAAAKASRPGRRRSGGVSSLLLEAVGYLAVALLFGTGFGRVVERGVHPVSSAPAVSGAAVPVTGSGADGVRVDFLENAPAGTIVVIRGRRSPAPPGTGLRVEWTAQGRPIPGAATVAGPVIPTSWLRETDPAELRRLLAAAAERPEALSGGAPSGSGFMAVFDSVPQGATGLRVSSVSLASAGPEQGSTAAAAPDATPAQGRGSAGGAALRQRPAPVGDAPSPSSPPSPHPSSG